MYENDVKGARQLTMQWGRLKGVIKTMEKLPQNTS
jgi:hypothetical protein